MQSRREQLQAYRFLTRRIVGGLVLGEPETNERPMRRFGLSVTFGLLLAAVIFAGVGVYGLVRPGGGRPAENALILERESGAKFLYLRGRLHPVLNFTSARLIAGTSTADVRTMSQNSLRDIPRGRPVGIAGLPDDLPASRWLLKLPWSVCSAPRSQTSNVQATYLFVGSAPGGGTGVGDRAGLLVSTADGTDRYLVYRDRRLRIRDNAAVAALGWAGSPVAPVSDGLLNALPAGPDLVAPAVTGSGERGPSEVGGAQTTVGQLFTAGDQYYVMTRTGLSAVGAVTGRLMEAGGTAATATTAAEAGRVLTTDRVEPAGFPTEIPDLRQDGPRGPMMCALYEGAPAADQPVAVQTYTAVSDQAQVVPEVAPPAQVGADGVRTADRVVLPGGRASVVRLLPPPGAATGTTYLITDQGFKYPMPIDKADAVKQSLGYGSVTPVSIPAALLALVPTGPALDPEAAALFIPPPAATGAASPGS
jgi:type VII secretion protein EccB